ncbi:hypothetical protein ACROYT_G007509 [Oculina patagonica]
MPESLVVEIKNTDEWMSGDVGQILCKLLPFCQQVMARKLSRVIMACTWIIPCLSSAPMLVANKVMEIEGLLLVPPVLVKPSVHCPELAVHASATHPDFNVSPSYLRVVLATKGTSFSW